MNLESGNISDEILNEVEASAFLKVNRLTLSKWRNAGAIGFYRPGGTRVVYSKAKHLEPFLDRCETKAAAETK